MPRQRTGSIELRRGSYFARVTVDVPEAERTPGGPTTRRDWYALGTPDLATARRRARKLLADLEAGRRVASRSTAPTVESFADELFDRRAAGGIVSVSDDRRWFDRWIKPAIGHLTLDVVTSQAIRDVLDTVVEAGLRRESVRKVRVVCHIIFDAAWCDEIIEANPVARVKLPAMREVRKERVILTDEEFFAFLSSDAADPELRLMALCARVEGGMRTSDVIRWDWTMIDTVDFAECSIPRSKTGEAQRIQIPAMLRPFLHARWVAVGCPVAGPVFPVRRGARAGAQRAARGVSFAGALKRDLYRAGVVRHACTRSPDAPLEHRDAPCCPGLARDPLYAETATTLPVDFHSFRRAFASALAAAGTNAQHAMRLANHSDPRVHMRYVMDGPEMRAIPDAAVPVLPAGIATRVAKPRKAAGET